MQSLKNLVINGAMILALLFGLTVSAAAALSASDFEHDKALAEKGDANYQVKLGLYYEEGTGVRQDYTQAFYWYQKSANQGNDMGQGKLGFAYLDGQGVRQDHRKAFEWLKKSAMQNNKGGQISVAALYAEGIGVRQNKTSAKEWYGKACDNGIQLGCDAYRILNEQGY